VVLSLAPDGVGVAPKIGTVNVAHQEVVLEANALQCIQKKLDAVVKVGFWQICRVLCM